MLVIWISSKLALRALWVFFFFLFSAYGRRPVIKMSSTKSRAANKKKMKKMHSVSDLMSERLSMPPTPRGTEEKPAQLLQRNEIDGAPAKS